MRSIRVTAALLLGTLLTVLLVPIGPATADPVALCTAQAAALKAVNDQVAQHNAQPHVFRLPSQSAAYNAYNAEAGALGAQRETARAALESCLSAMKTLEDNATGAAELAYPKPETIQQLTDAIKQIPAGYQMPPGPAPGKFWSVPPGTPARPLYDALRKITPPDNLGNVQLRAQSRPVAGAADPAFPAAQNRVIGSAATGSAVSPDHIIPLTEIMYLPGFLKLTPQNMYVVVNAPVNLQWMSFSANNGKRSRSVAYWAKADPAWQAQQVQLETGVRQQLRDTIALLLKAQGQ